MRWFRKAETFGTIHSSAYPAAVLMVISLIMAFSAEHARGQVVYSARRDVKSLWAGAEYSNVNASFPYQSDVRLSGAGAFVDFNWNGRIGVEGDARFLHFGNFYGETESSFLAGPRYLFPTWRHWQPYGKVLFGEGRIHYPFSIGDGSYFALAPGGGVNYRLSYRWTVRGEYEYQLWPESPGFTNEPSHDLKPNGFHVGIAYRPFR